jgi:hypothetical protein
MAKESKLLDLPALSKILPPSSSRFFWQELLLLLLLRLSFKPTLR